MEKGIRCNNTCLSSWSRYRILALNKISTCSTNGKPKTNEAILVKYFGNAFNTNFHRIKKLKSLNQFFQMVPGITSIWAWVIQAINMEPADSVQIIREIINMSWHTSTFLYLYLSRYCVNWLVDVVICIWRKWRKINNSEIKTPVLIVLMVIFDFQLKYNLKRFS